MKKYLVLLVAVAVIAGCAPKQTGQTPTPAAPEQQTQQGPDRLIEGPVKPDWADNPMKFATAETFAFSGESDPVATGQMSKDDARERAQLRALEEVWGVYLERAFKTIKARAPQMKLDPAGLEVIQDESFAKITTEMGKAKGIIKGEVGEYVVQRWERKDPTTNKLQYFYRGYALLRVPRNMVQALVMDTMADAAQDARISRGKKEMNSAIDTIKKFSSAEGDIFKESE
jgi:hypothetical protein